MSVILQTSNSIVKKLVVLLALTTGIIQEINAQTAQVTYSTRVDKMVMEPTSCNEFIELLLEKQYTGYLFSNDNVNATKESSGCQSCDVPAPGPFTGDSLCIAGAGKTIVTNRTNTATIINFFWESWEDDSAPRCSYESSEDDCYVNTEAFPVSFRRAIPSNGVWTSTKDVNNDPSSYGALGELFEQHAYGDFTYRYSGTENLIEVTCISQREDWGLNLLSAASFSAILTAGETYRFSTNCTGGPNKKVWVYDSDGYTSIAVGNCVGNMSIAEFTPTVSGVYYIEVRDRTRNGVYGYLEYERLANCNQPPIALCKDIAVDTDENCVVGITAIEVDNGSSDPEGGNLTYEINLAGPFGGGTHSVTLTVTDVGGLSATCNATITVTVIDEEAPEITCPPDITVNTDPSICGAIINESLTNPVSMSDNCETTLTHTLTGNPYSLLSPYFVGGLGTLGTTTIFGGSATLTYTLTDEGGNQATCTVEITVDDNVLPTLECPEDINTSSSGSSCSSVEFYDIFVSDNCPYEPINVAELITGLPSGSSFPYGSTLVTYQFTDQQGNTSNCSFEVIVQDAVAPEIECPEDITEITNNEGCTAIFDWEVVATDNCATNLELESNFTPADAFPIGTTTVFYSVYDNDGNEASCEFTVTVDFELSMDIVEVVDVVCFEGSTGEVYITPLGTNTPFTFEWSDGSTNEDLVNVPAGSYNVVITDAAGCTYESDFIDIDQLDVPELVVTVVTEPSSGAEIPDGSASASAIGGVGSYTYEWQNGLGSNPNLPGLTAGTYCVEVTDDVGCIEIECGDVDFLTSILNLAIVNDIKVYPNPANKIAIIDLELVQKAEVDIELIDVEGRILKSFNSPNSKAIKAQFEINDVPAGHYFFRIKIDAHVASIPLSITR